jgi:hypothetical protein
LLSLKQDVKPAASPDMGRRRSQGTSFRGKSARDWICCGVILLVWLAVWTPRLRGPLTSLGREHLLCARNGLSRRQSCRLNEPGEIHAVIRRSTNVRGGIL